MGGSGVQRELNRSQKVEVALQNEYLTRQRVDRIEPTIGALIKQTQALLEICHRDFWGRMKWLATGK